MATESPRDLQGFLEAASRGEAGAADELLPHVYDHLRALAGKLMRGERKGHTLQPTALVHEAFVRLMRDTSVQWTDRAWFLAIAARAMRHILIEHARKRNAGRRGGGEWARVTLDDKLELHADSPGAEILDLHAALEELARLHERLARVVELRFFGGLTIAETAHVLGVSDSTIEADWVMARTWLATRLSS